MVKRVGAYGIIFKRVKNAPLFLLVDWNGKGTFPGGGRKKGETLEQTFLREVKEELGIQKEDFKFFLLTDFKKAFVTKVREGWGEHKEIHRYFLAELKPEATVSPSPEIPGIVWLPFEEAKAFLFWEDTKKIFADIVRNYQNLIKA